MREEKSVYCNIDMQETGRKLKELAELAGYTPKKLQNCLHLSCPQPIYRWYKGLILPSIDHLFMLSELLGVHMEELLIKKSAPIPESEIGEWEKQDGIARYVLYYSKIRLLAA